MAHPPLPSALSGELHTLNGRAGRLVACVAGEGPPLLLIHSINAAGCAAEVRPLHEHYRRTRTVFSIDLPGYGLSERPDRDYTPRLMTDAVLDLLDLARTRCGPVPIDALALSLSSEFLARAAAEAAAGRFARLALVSPTGLGSAARLLGEASRARTRGDALAAQGAVLRGRAGSGAARCFAG